jgi:hypothetical protein
MKSISLINSIPHNIISLHPPKYNIKNEEGKYIFVGKIYGVSNINNDFSKVLDFLENFIILNQDELLNANNGVYNWILYSEDNSNIIKFAATQVLSAYELGTNHQSIAYHKKVNAKLVYGGGELKKEDKKIIFNILSGTYTYVLKLIDYDDNVPEKICNKIVEFFPDANFNNTYESYIDSVETVSNKLLELYKNNGFIVKMFEIYNDYANFSNKFWHIDFSIEHFKKKLDDKTENENIIRTLYMESIESMINLLKND